ncbi:hypothetical protein B0A55_10795 [Friedmanniomyces simplex]|uniref:F-box domain-containing protein n=1 Tax=Friedmanniomyces simplex TaxID=329884 RepID=A0A4U0X2C3_9PEZI|nr:hypothetical protein B0A55_10795 [Friedmanniomyces simplex]
MATTAETQGTKSTAPEGDKDAMPQPHLDKLPEELVSNIAHRLDYDDITSLRLVCRTLEARSFHDFATEYFSAKGFIISTESLKVLCAIANNKRLRRYLHSIYIVTALFSDSALNCPSGCRCSWKPAVRQAETYRTYINDQKQLKDTGEDKRMLAEAFQQLTKVTGLFIADRPHHGECIEGAMTYGIQKIGRRTARSPLHSPNIDKKNKEYSRWCAHVWKILCQSVSESGMSTITRFGTYTDKAPDGLSVSHEFKLGPKTIIGMTKALQNLKSLKLSVRGNSLIQKDGRRDAQANLAVISKLAGTMRAAPLEDVTLSYDMTPASGFIHLALMRSLDLSKLTKLSVDGVYMAASSLVTVLSALTSIVDLQLSWTNLTKGNWVPVLQAIQKLEDLQHLHLMWLQEAGRKVYFLAQRDTDPDEGWFDDGDADFDANEDDEEDEDLPDLEPAPGYEPPAAAKAESFRVDAPLAPKEEEEDFEAPGYEGQLERGYYICLKGSDQLAKYLPIFIKEYNLGENLDHDDHDLPLPPGMPFPGMGGLGGGPGAAAGQAALNAVMNSIFGGGPPPPHGTGPPPVPSYGGGGAAGAGGGGHAHGHGSNHGAGGGHGPPPLPGFVTMGDGPGYQMTMGSMAMPMPPFPAGNGAGAGGPPPPPQPAGLANGGANAGAAAAGAQADAGAADDFDTYFDTELEDGEEVS